MLTENHEIWNFNTAELLYAFIRGFYQNYVLSALCFYQKKSFRVTENWKNLKKVISTFVYFLTARQNSKKNFLAWTILGPFLFCIICFLLLFELGYLHYIFILVINLIVYLYILDHSSFHLSVVLYVTLDFVYTSEGTIKRSTL